MQNRLDFAVGARYLPNAADLRIESLEGEMWLINPFNGERLMNILWKSG